MTQKKKKSISAVQFIFLFFIVLFGLVSIIGTSGDEIDEDEDVSTAQSINTLPTAAINSPADASVYSEGVCFRRNGN